MDNETKGLLDALHDQIMERNTLQQKLDVALKQVNHLGDTLDHTLGKLAPNRKGWAVAFTMLVDEGDYVSASKLASVALDDRGLTPDGPMRSDWVLRHEMARRLLDESRKH